MLVGLYTLRKVLDILGVEEYGIYNLVCGVVVVFNFLGDAMSATSQRFFSFEISRKNFENLQKLFCINIEIYIFISLVFLVASETIGVWFVKNVLIIPPNRLKQALFVYQCSLFSFICLTLITPFKALIIAHEKMSIHAYISIIEVLLKFFSVFILGSVQSSRLQMYGLLLFGATVINTLIYLSICCIKFNECKHFKFYWNSNIFKENIIYTGWNLFGILVNSVNIHIINILLNRFFPLSVVTARSISLSIKNVVNTFSLNFNIVLRSQLVKYWSIDDRQKMIRLMFQGIKGTFILIYIFVLPCMIEMPIILNLWLSKISEEAVLFTRLILVNVLIDSLSYPIEGAVYATGNVKVYQLLVSGILLFNLPVSWLLLTANAPASSVMLVSIVISVFAFFLRIIIMKHLIEFSPVLFFKKVIPRIIIMVIFSLCPVLIINHILPNSVLRLFITAGTSIFLLILLSYFVLFDKEEKKRILQTIMLNIEKFRKVRICS
jgi:O-antigen/teichoic acid export membrane protein